MMMETTPFAGVAPQLRANGYSPLPIKPGEKAPGWVIGTAWILQSKWSSVEIDDAYIEEASTFWNAGLGVRTGDNDLVAVDLDTDEHLEELIAILPKTPVMKTGRKGMTLFYRGPGIGVQRIVDPRDADLEAKKRRRICDILGKGGQTVLPPTLHPDTLKPYEWKGSRPLCEVPIGELPLLEQADLDMLIEKINELFPKPDGRKGQARAERRKEIVRKEDGPDAPHRRLNDHALANLGAWVPELKLLRCREARGGYEAVATWRESSTGRDLNLRKRNLKIHPEGIVDEGDGPKTYTPIDLVMTARGCDLDAAFGWLSGKTDWGKIPFDPDLEEEVVAPAPVKPAPTPVPLPTKSVEEIAAALPKYEPKVALAEAFDPPTVASDRPIMIVEDELVLRQRALEAYAWVDQPLEEPDARDLPGAVGAAVRCMLMGTRGIPSPSLALSSALGMVGVTANRRVLTPTRSMTHLWIVPLADTGFGKDLFLNAPQDMLAEAGLGILVAPETFGSDRELLKYLPRRLACVSFADEYGSYLKRITAAKAPPHLMGITATLRKAFSACKNVRTEQVGTSPSQLMIWPSYSIVGFGVRTHFYESITGGDVADGTFNRMLVVDERRTDLKKQGGDHDAYEYYKRDVVKMLRDLYHNGPASASGMEAFNMARADIAPKLPVMTWETVNRHALLDEKCNAMMEEDPARREYMKRTAEIVQRVAAVISWGRNEGLVLRDEDFDFAERWVMFHTLQAFGEFNKVLDERTDGRDMRQVEASVVRWLRMRGGKAQLVSLYRGPAVLQKASRREKEEIIRMMSEQTRRIKIVRESAKPDMVVLEER